MFIVIDQHLLLNLFDYLGEFLIKSTLLLIVVASEIISSVDETYIDQD